MIKQPKATSQHQAALSQQATQPQQQAQDPAGYVIFNPPVTTSQQTGTLMPGFILTVHTSLTSTCVDAGITATTCITASHQPTLNQSTLLQLPLGIM